MKKILIIDDDIDICKQIKYNLQNETTEAYYATSVTDALLFLMRNDCCLIILELTNSQLLRPHHQLGASQGVPARSRD